MNSVLRVRIGTTEDMAGMMELAAMACEENGFVNPDMGKLATEMWPALCQDHGIVGIIGEPGKQIEGAVLLRVGQMWYSQDLVFEEKAIFTHPDFRQAKGGRARLLTDFSKKIADGLGIPLMIGVLSNNRTEAKVRMYEREFGRPAGAFFLYGAMTGQVKMEH